MKKTLLSQALQNIGGEQLRLQDQTIIFDQEIFDLPINVSLYLKDCTIIVDKELEQGTLINITGSLVFINCEIDGIITIQSLSEMNLSLSRRLGEVGKSISCQRLKAIGPYSRINIKGNFETVNFTTEKSPYKLSLNLYKVKFKKSHISGHFTDLDISLCRGNTLKLNCIWSSSFALSGYGMKPEIDNIIFTEQTTHHLADLLSQKKSAISSDLNVKYIFYFLKKQQDIHGYQTIYNAYCDWKYRNAFKLKKAKEITFTELITDIFYYKFLRGFQSVRRMLLICIGEIFLFATLYYIIANYFPSSLGGIKFSQESIYSFFDMLYYSTITFTTVGYGDIRPYGIVRFLAAVEGFVGVFSILVSSFVFTRSYGEFE